MALYVGGTAVTGTQTLDATRLSGNLPAISGASLTGIPADYVKVGETNISSNTASLSFDNSVISSTYNHYRILVRNGIVATDNNNIFFRISTDNGSSFLATSIYYRIIIANPDDASHNDILTRHGASSTAQLGHVASTGNASGESCSAELIFHNVHSTSEQKFVSVNGMFMDHNGDGRICIGGFRINTTDAISGVQFSGASNITKGDFVVYGVKD